MITADNASETMMAKVAQLKTQWAQFKHDERVAAESRRSVEDELIEILGVQESLEGTQIHELTDGSKIKVVGRMNRKVDPEKLRDLAAEHGVEDHLANLVRWKAELNLTAWKHADDSITNPLSGAITTKPGRPSFSFEENNNG